MLKSSNNVAKMCKENNVQCREKKRKVVQSKRVQKNQSSLGSKGKTGELL